MKNRKTALERITKETNINIDINLDGTGTSKIQIGIPFMEHMLEQVSKHGMFDIELNAKGDLHIDAHHTVEDVGIVLGQSFDKVLGNKMGITRFGSAYIPLDESLSRVVLDFSGRPGLEFNVKFPRSRVGEFDIDLLQEFFQGFVNHAFITLHIDNLSGNNAHHQCESIFKSFAQALKVAVSIDSNNPHIPSTKGIL